MAKKQTEIAVSPTGSFPISEILESSHLLTRRQMLGTGMTGLAALNGISSSGIGQTAQTRPRIACLVSYWGATRSHADWIVNKLIDGYWWQGAYTPSRVEVLSVYM